MVLLDQELLADARPDANDLGHVVPHETHREEARVDQRGFACT
jgi:hypothetical protein